MSFMPFMRLQSFFGVWLFAIFVSLMFVEAKFLQYNGEAKAEKKQPIY